MLDVKDSEEVTRFCCLSCWCFFWFTANCCIIPHIRSWPQLGSVLCTAIWQAFHRGKASYYMKYCIVWKGLCMKKAPVKYRIVGSVALCEDSKKHSKHHIMWKHHSVFLLYSITAWHLTYHKKLLMINSLRSLFCFAQQSCFALAMHCFQANISTAKYSR
jgi:hypothetical protein